jgi:hypothetical protein
MPHVEIWLTQTDGRMGALVDAMNLGADGLLAEDGTLHRLAAQHGPTPQNSAVDFGSAPVERRPRENGHGTELLPENDPASEATPQNPPSLVGGPQNNATMESSFGSVDSAQNVSDDGTIGEPVLTADELRALLQDQPSMPPSGNEER